jgi:hypothetical protein
MRPTHEHERRELKTATYRLCLELGVSEAAGLTRVNAPALTKYGAGHEDAFMPVDVAVDLMRAAGKPILLEAMAAQLGLRLVSAAPVESGGDKLEVLSRAKRDITAAFAEFTVVANGADADGHIDIGESDQIFLALEEIIAKCREAQRVRR